MPRIIDVDAPTNRVFVSQFVIEQMRRIPPIDSESLRPHGRWEEINGYLRCSECKDVYIYEDWIEDGKWKFCPNCGAKMDKEMLESEVSE